LAPDASFSTENDSGKKKKKRKKITKEEKATRESRHRELNREVTYQTTASKELSHFNQSSGLQSMPAMTNHKYLQKSKQPATKDYYITEQPRGRALQHSRIFS